MDTDKLTAFFAKKLEEIPRLRQLNGTDDPAFNTWWNAIKATSERMGKEYVNRASGVNFWGSSVVVGDYSAAEEKQDYLQGLDQAQSFMEALIEELNLWGFKGQPQKSTASKNSALNGNVVLNLTISQKQAQEITQTIHLSQYNQDVQDCVKQLLDELKRQDKDKNKIIGLVKWLADKGADALIAILLASTNLTT